MKKTLLILISLFISLGIYAQESPTSPSQSDTYDKAAPYPWTFGVKGGINYFRLHDNITGHFLPDSMYNTGTYDDVSQQVAIFAEYAFDKFFALGLYIGNYNYNRMATYGSSIESGVYVHLNLMECFSWRKSPLIARRLHINLDAGIGGAAWWQNPQMKGNPASDHVYWNGYAVGKGALQFEFFIRPQWSLLLEGEYHIYASKANYYPDIARARTAWTNAGALNLGFRYYFDTRKNDNTAREDGLDENNLPIRKKKERKQKVNVKQSKNAVYVNVNVTGEMLEEARATGKPVSVMATEAGSTSPNVEVVSTSSPESSEINGALATLSTLGRGDAEMNTIRFDAGNELTPAAQKALDEIAASLLNNHEWKQAEFLYICNGDAQKKAAAIQNYLQAKGVKNITVMGRETKDNAQTNDLMVSIQ